MPSVEIASYKPTLSGARKWLIISEEKKAARLLRHHLGRIMALATHAIASVEG
jgi:hypothetical protein